MEAYAEYKDSGVDWLGQVPADWSINKLKHFGKMFAGLAGKSGNDFSKEAEVGHSKFVPYTSIANGPVVRDDRQYVRIHDFEKQNRVITNDLLFLMSSETLEDIGKNSIFLSQADTPYLNSFCKGFRIHDEKLAPPFANYLLQSDIYRNYFAQVARGFTRINLKQEFILNADLPVPSMLTQNAIADFLDDKVGKVEELVAIKQAQIALLKERKQILIQEAVTKGLNPNAPMKDSGIDWIGQIPAHWGREAVEVCL